MEGLVDAIERAGDDALVVAEEQAGQDDDETNGHQVAAQLGPGRAASSRAGSAVADRFEVVTTAS